MYMYICIAYIEYTYVYIVYIYTYTIYIYLIKKNQFFISPLKVKRKTLIKKINY